MKKLLPILLATSLLLSACSINVDNKKDDLFQKKQECANLEKNMWEQLNSNERYGGRIEGTTLYLSMIFYSPTRNSCLYKSEFVSGESYLFEINDFFTKEVVYSQSCTGGKNQLYSECFADFEKEIQKLKGE